MGLFDSMKANSLGNKAYKKHVMALQMRRNGKFDRYRTMIEEAYALYQKAYELGFRKSTVMLAYAILTMQNGDFPKARAMMLEVEKDKALAKEDRFTLRVNYAICQWKMGELDKAIETMRSAALTKTDSLVYTTLGMFLVEKARETGDFEEAIAYNKEALDYDDEDGATLDNFGTIYLLLSEREADADKAAEYRKLARENFEKAHEYRPDQVTTLYYLAQMEMEDGNNDRAKKLLAESHELPHTALCPVTKADIAALEAKL